MTILFSFVTYAIAIVAGGAGGYLYGAKVKSTVTATAAKVDTAAKAVASDVKKV